MTDLLWAALAVFHVIVFGYFVLLNGYYFVMSVFAFRTLRRYARRLRLLDLDDATVAATAPPATLVAAGYNEEASCRESVRSFLSLEYPDYEVIFVNDGSTDGTLDALKDEFDLALAPRFPTAQLDTSAVRHVYRSRTRPDLWVIDKENGGRADALNVGINYCRTPLFCLTDADTIIERDALMRLATPFLEDDQTVASGGVIRIANGCTVERGTVKDVRLPERLVPSFQVLEYLRSFLSGRVGWDALQIMFLVSGAFGLFRRDAVVEVGGLAADSIGEDMELTVRLHRHFRDEDRPYSIHFVPDPVAWTEAPATMRVLGRQRDRWQRGLMDTLSRHRRMLFNPRYGRLGFVAYPFFFFFEMLGPVVEFTGYLVFLGILFFGVASLPFAIAFLLVAILLGTVLSIISVGLEEMSFRRYEHFGDLLRLFGLAFLENLGFRQALTYYRLRGMISYFRGEQSWGEMERQGFQKEN